MIQKVFRDDATSAVQIKLGTNTSKIIKNLLKVIHVLEGLPQAKHLRMLNLYRLQSIKTGNWQLVGELEADLGIPKTTVSEILT